MCEAYASQLSFEELPHKAVAYLLCINKIHEAVDTFVAAKLYKEAYVLASSKLDAKDPITTSILREWANSAQKDGNFQSAAEWFEIIFYILIFFFMTCYILKYIIKSLYFSAT